MAVEVEARREVYDAGHKRLEDLGKQVSARIQQVIGINVPVMIVPYDTIPRSEGKAKRIIDERNT